VTCINGNERHDGTADDFGCRVKSFTVNPRSMPTRLHPENPPRQPNPAWERGIAKDERGMPYLTEGGGYLGVKQYAENRHRIEDHKRQLHHLASTQRR